MGIATLKGYARPSSAVSPEAEAVQQAVSAVAGYAERSHALFGGKALAISQLRALANECAEEGWDGDESCALEQTAVFIAEAFVRALPNDIPLPEFAPEPDGSISLDWIKSRNRLFSISIGNSFRLGYAWLDGTDKGHAVARFDGESIPSRILEGIREIMNHGDTPEILVFPR